MGGSKYLERMARAAIVRPDKAPRSKDTGTKYPAERQRGMAEREQASPHDPLPDERRRSEVLRTTLQCKVMTCFRFPSESFLPCERRLAALQPATGRVERR